MNLKGCIGVFAVSVALGVGGFFALNPSPSAAATLTPEQRAALQTQYDQLQQEIAQYQKVIDDTKAKEKSLQGDVTTLNATIAKAQTEIKQRTVQINQLSDQINQKTQTITSLEDRLAQGQDALAKLLRQKQQTESSSLVEVALSSGSVSDFFDSVDQIDQLDQSLQQHFDELRGVKTETEQQKAQLAAQQSAQQDARYSAQLLQKQVTQTKQQKVQLLTETKGQESEYNQVLAQKQQQAAAIRAQLFNLRDTQGISFGSALQYATVAGNATGVRPALILAILSQESDLGNNIGSCYITSLVTGDGVSKINGAAYEKVMKAPRDTDPFETLMDAVGRQWATAPVSCPLGRTYSTSRGYGGAMGPSQFIPSTWVLFEPRITAALGTSGTPDPFDPQAAIAATALYLKDLGAAAGGYTAERNAACKYYSGRSCDSRSPVNYTYGNSVIAKAETFQNNIDFLNNL
ncbi:MAG: lytic murein transglycosylase [Patescibacteria group bacterium]|nr:lytic murein transglycosylase [Patescibacteria group bacterium]